MQVTPAVFDRPALLGFGPAVPSVFQTGTTLIVLGTGRRQPPELDMALVQHPVSIDDSPAAGSHPQRQNQVDHDGGRLPFAWRYPGIQISV
jgi:hypothetical protein